MYYWMIRWGSIIFFKLFLRAKVYGKENIPAKGAFIFAANHTSYLDPFLLTVSTKRPLYFITRDKVLSKTIFGWIMRHANTIPVKRRGGDLSAIRESLRVLAKGNVLGIFPEGTRSKDRTLKRAKSGVGMIVYKAKVPVVPAYIEGTFDALPRGTKTFKRLPVRINIGKAVYFTKEYTGEQGKEVYKKISDEIMFQISELGRLNVQS